MTHNSMSAFLYMSVYYFPKKAFERFKRITHLVIILDQINVAQFIENNENVLTISFNIVWIIYSHKK